MNLKLFLDRLRRSVRRQIIREEASVCLLKMLMLVPACRLLFTVDLKLQLPKSRRMKRR